MVSVEKKKVIILTIQSFLGLVPLYIGAEIVIGIAILNKAAGFYGFLSIITGHPINFWQWLYNVLEILCLPFYISALTLIKKKPENGRKFLLACLVYVIDTVVGVFYTLYFVHFWFANEEVVTNKRDFAMDLPVASFTEFVDEAMFTAEPTALSVGISTVEGLASVATSAVSAVVASAAASVSSGVASAMTSATLSTTPLLGQLQLATREIFMTAIGTILITVVRFYFTLIMLSFNKALLKQLKVEEQYDRKDEDEERILLGSGVWNRVERVVLEWQNRAKQFMGDMLLSKFNN